MYESTRRTTEPLTNPSPRWWTLRRGVVFAVYLAWAYTPETTLHHLGVTYYPDKHWAAAVPIWVCTAVLYGAWMYDGVNRMSVKHTDAVELFEDRNGVIPRGVHEPDPPARGLAGCCCTRTNARERGAG